MLGYELKKEEIKEIALNPHFCSKDDYETLVNQGFPVRWMMEDEANKKNIFEVTITEND